SNPAQLLDYLKASGGVEQVGHAQVRGVATTRYRGTLDLETLADRVPADMRSQAREAVSKLVEKTGLRFIPAEAWVDQQSRVRRFDLSFALAEGGQRLAM